MDKIKPTSPDAQVIPPHPVRASTFNLTPPPSLDWGSEADIPGIGIKVSSKGTVKGARLGASPSNRGNWVELVDEPRLEILFFRDKVAIVGEIGSSIECKESVYDLDYSIG